MTVKHKFQDSHRKRDQQECQKQLAKSDNLVKKCHALETRILEMEVLGKLKLAKINFKIS